MEGSLLKKTTAGLWHERTFTLVGANLTWLKSDNKTTITVDVSRATEIRDIKIGPRKFAFEIILPGDVITLAASGEAEKAAWMAALKVVTGKREEAEGILQKSGAGRMSVRTPVKPPAFQGKGPASTTPKVGSPLKGPVAQPVPTQSTAAPAPAPATAPSSSSSKPPVPTSVVGGLSAAANEKLQAKLGGKLNLPQQVLCVVCGQTVYKPEELIVDKAKMHKRCFQCAHCKRLLTMGNFACINGTFYCKVHYFELFATSGGKYDAFGDAGFKTKATTAYTPGDILKPGALNSKLAAAKPAAPAKPVSAQPEAKAAEVATSGAAQSSPVKAAEAKQAPKKLEIKAPTSTKAVEKTNIEVIPKKNMDDLRKLVVLPGQAPPPKLQKEKEQPAPEASPETEEKDEPKPTSDESTPDAPIEEEKGAEDQTEAPEPEALASEEPIQIVKPPQGVNFALEAMKIRQAQLMKQGVVFQQPEERSSSGNENRNSVRVAGKLDHSAVLSKPRMMGRRAPKVQEVGKLLPKAEIDRLTHDWTFRVRINGPSTDVLVVHATSQFEKEHWVATLSANVYMLGLRRDLEQAQKKDMMSALQAQAALEQFLADNQVTYTGFLEKVSMKSQRNWKKRWFKLTDNGEFMYYENENSKKPKHTLQLSHLTVIEGADGSRLDAPLVINTGASGQDHGTDESGQLPQNIAIFDNQDVTIDLQTIVAPELQQQADEPVPQTQQSTESSDADYVVVEKSEAVEDAAPKQPATEQAVSEQPAEASTEQAAPTSEKATDADEKSNASPVAASEETKAMGTAESESEPTQDEKRINTAWATPGKSPDRVGKSSEEALKDALSSSKEDGRRKSGVNGSKKCIIM